MCYEFSGWFKKARVAEQSKKAANTTEAAKQQSRPATPAQNPAPGKPVKEAEKILA